MVTKDVLARVQIEASFELLAKHSEAGYNVEINLVLYTIVTISEQERSLDPTAVEAQL